MASKTSHHLATAISTVAGIPDVVDMVSTDGEVLVGVIGSLGKAAADWLSDPNTIDIVNAGFSMLGTAAAVCPFLLPVQIALRDIGSAMKGALYNREVAKALYTRCAESATVVAKMQERIMQMNTDEVLFNSSLSLCLMYVLTSYNLHIAHIKDKTQIVVPIQRAIEECSAFIKIYTTKGFLRNMWNQSGDQRNLTVLDKKVTLSPIFCENPILTNAFSYILIITSFP